MSYDPKVRDVKETALRSETEDHFTHIHGPSFGELSGAVDLSVSPKHDKIAFTGSTWHELEGEPQSRICMLDLGTGGMEIFTEGPYEDKVPKWSPDGDRIAFLSDRVESGVFQLCIGQHQDLTKAVQATSGNTTIEYFHWSSMGARILIGLAGGGADKAGKDGSGTITTGKDGKSDLPSWMPAIESNKFEAAWRTLWIHDTSDGSLHQCEANHALAILSETPGEEAWYSAKLVKINLDTGEETDIHHSERQLGLPVSSPSGKRAAVLQALCSDRGIIAGDILLIDLTGGEGGIPTAIDINHTDATHLAWTDEDHLFYTGLRGLQTVAGIVNVEEKTVHELWLTDETCGSFYPEACPLGSGFVAVCESWTRYPEIALIDKDKYQTILSLDHGGGQWLMSKLGPVESVTWRAPDGLDIQGLLYLPTPRDRPLPLVLAVHGGPVYVFRKGVRPYISLLVSRGYAVLCPNPRGSAGRGQKFAEMVYGDMGGADTQDYLTGVDAMVDRGIADPARLGVTGGSYGGYISSWLITQTDRFAAAVPVAPVTDWLTQHTTTNIPHFDSIFLDRKPYAPNGLYFQRSPLRFAGRYPTPVLQISGARDRCTPPVQALQYHRALLEHKVESVLVTYPEEGHGVRKFPAYIDFCCRLLSWFDTYMPV